MDAVLGAEAAWRKTARRRRPEGKSFSGHRFSEATDSVEDKYNKNCYNTNMPTISRFYGILIQMYYDDHNPPHFHAIYNENKALIGINDFSLIYGDLPPKAYNYL